MRTQRRNDSRVAQVRCSVAGAQGACFVAEAGSRSRSGEIGDYEFVENDASVADRGAMSSPRHPLSIPVARSPCTRCTASFRASQFRSQGATAGTTRRLSVSYCFHYPSSNIGGLIANGVKLDIHIRYKSKRSALSGEYVLHSITFCRIFFEFSHTDLSSPV